MTSSNITLQAAEQANPREANMPETRVRVILVDDDDNYCEAFGGELDYLGFDITSVPDGRALALSLEENPNADAILLDWKLNVECGLDVLHNLRRRGVQLPVLFLTGNTSKEFEQEALEHGALDFVDKTRGAQIVAQRIRLIVDTNRQLTASRLPVDEMICGPVVLRPKTSRAFINDVDVGLTVTEFNIVHLLASQAGEYATYRAIYDCVHGPDFVAGYGEDGFRTNVRSLIKRIRTKLNAACKGYSPIENFPAFGYRWCSDTDKTPPQP
jgi:two-component system response regulator ChvI